MPKTTRCAEIKRLSHLQLSFQLISNLKELEIVLRQVSRTAVDVCEIYSIPKINKCQRYHLAMTSTIVFAVPTMPLIIKVKMLFDSQSLWSKV